MLGHKPNKDFPNERTCNEEEDKHGCPVCNQTSTVWMSIINLRSNSGIRLTGDVMDWAQGSPNNNNRDFDILVILKLDFSNFTTKIYIMRIALVA